MSQRDLDNNNNDNDNDNDNDNNKIVIDRPKNLLD